MRACTAHRRRTTSCWPRSVCRSPISRATAIQDAGHEQGELDLFASEETEAPAKEPRAKLMAAMDALNDRFGRDSVRIGSTTVASKNAEAAVWATKQERRSPRYTTRWDEMLVVRA
jgi:DNA polymerase V